MTTYTFAQLESLWIQAGGSAALAPLMAGVAEVESGGNPQAYNPSGASGLWQIEIPVNESYVPGGAGNVFNALDNAKAAVALSGNTLAGITANWLDFEPSGAAEAIAKQNGGTVPSSSGTSSTSSGGSTGTASSSGTGSGTSPASSGVTLTTDIGSQNPLEEGLGAVGSWINDVPYLGGFAKTIEQGWDAATSVNHLIAYLIDYPLSMFKPGQAWRIVFTVIAALLGIASWKTYGAPGAQLLHMGDGSTQGSEETHDKLPLAILLLGLAILASFMAFRPWPNPDGKPIKPGAYAYEILEGQVPAAGPPAVSPAEVQTTEFALDLFAAIWAFQKVSSTADNIATAIEEAKQAALGWWGNLI